MRHDGGSRLSYERERSLTLVFSPGAAPLEEQLRAQGYRLEWYYDSQAQADAITKLALADLITESTAARARERLFKRILRDAEPIRTAVVS